MQEWIQFDRSQATSSILSGELVVVYGRGTSQEAHKLVEILSSEILGCTIEYDALKTNFRGKPLLTGNLQFNISHTNQTYLLAFCMHFELGIDMEDANFKGDLEQMSAYAFSPDEVHFIKSHPYRDAFLKIWTLKEAYLKATGLGLIDALPTLHAVNTATMEVKDSHYSSIQFICSLNETGSLVCRGSLPPITWMQV